MADKSIVSNEKLAAIAQAIKAKDATATLPMTVDEMAAAIAAIPTGMHFVWINAWKRSTSGA